jgi:hypothetical protein
MKWVKIEKCKKKCEISTSNVATRWQYVLGLCLLQDQQKSTMELETKFLRTISLINTDVKCFMQLGLSLTDLSRLTDSLVALSSNRVTDKKFS